MALTGHQGGRRGYSKQKAMNEVDAGRERRHRLDMMTTRTRRRRRGFKAKAKAVNQVDAALLHRKHILCDS